MAWTWLSSRYLCLCAATNLKSYLSRKESLYAVLPERHPLGRRGKMSIEDLRDEPFLLLRDGHCFRETAIAACKRAHLNPQIIFESGQFSSILSMVGAGFGVSIIPEMALEKRPGCRFVPLSDDRAARTIGAVTLKGKSATRLQQAFLDHLRAQSSPAAAHATSSE